METAALEEIVFFAVPSEESADDLCRRLSHDRLAWLHWRGGVPHVAATLHDDEPGDLAWVLRTAQEWARGSGFATIPFELDGRLFALRATSSLALARV